MARSLALLFGTGATLVFATLALPLGSGSDDALLAIPPALAVVAAIVLLRFAGRLSVDAMQAILAGGSALITLCVIWGGDASSAYPFMYVWVSLWAFTFLRSAAAWAQVAGLAALYVVALIGQEDTPVPSAHWLVAIGTVAVGGALVGRLTHAIRGQAADAAAISQMASGLADVSEYAPATCLSLWRSTGADVVVLLEFAPGEGDGMAVVAMAGDAGAGTIFDAGRVLEALERCHHEAQPRELVGEPSAGLRGRLRGDVVGWAQPVVRDGEVAAVLAVGWTTRRRSISVRTRTAAVMFATEASLAMGRAERRRAERERQALEINDNIVQGLVVAKYSAQRGDNDASLAAIDETLRHARQLISEQLRFVGEQSGTGIKPGDLARETASQVATAAPEPPPAAPSAG